MSATLAIYDKLTLEMREALKYLCMEGGEGYSSWAGTAISTDRVDFRHFTTRRPTLDALVRRELATKEEAKSGTFRYYATKLGRDVGQE